MLLFLCGDGGLLRVDLSRLRRRRRVGAPCCLLFGKYVEDPLRPRGADTSPGSPGEEMRLWFSCGFVDGPVVVEAGVEAEVFHVLHGVGGHLGAAVWIEGEFDECVGPCFLIFDGEDESGFVFGAVVVDDFLWASLICCDDGDSRGLGFHDDLSEGVGGGGEGEEVAGGVEGGEFLGVFEAEEVCVVCLEFVLHFWAVWAVTDDDELCWGA